MIWRFFDSDNTAEYAFFRLLRKMADFAARAAFLHLRGRKKYFCRLCERKMKSYDKNFSFGSCL
jgi:hypothetical protein